MTNRGQIGRPVGQLWTPPGLTLISANTFSGALTFSLPTDSFTATYQNYLLLFVISSTHVAGTQLTWKLRTAGVDNSGASYNSSMLGDNSGATLYVGSVGNTGFFIGYASAAAQVAGQITINAPKEAVRTRMQCSAEGSNIGDTFPVNLVGGGNFGAATVFDALTLISAAGNIAGNYQLFGYANA